MAYLLVFDKPVYLSSTRACTLRVSTADRYLSPWRVGWRSLFLNHLTRRLLQRSHATSTLPEALLYQPTNLTPMDHSNNFGSYRPLTDEEHQAYQFPAWTDAIEQTGQTAHNILTNRWDMTGEPDLAASTHTGVTHRTGYGERYGHPFVDRFLTRDFQSRWLRPPSTSTRTQSTGTPYP